MVINKQSSLINLAVYINGSREIEFPKINLKSSPQYISCSVEMSMKNGV